MIPADAHRGEGESADRGAAHDGGDHQDQEHGGRGAPSLTCGSRAHTERERRFDAWTEHCGNPRRRARHHEGEVDGRESKQRARVIADVSSAPVAQRQHQECRSDEPDGLFDRACQAEREIPMASPRRLVIAIMSSAAAMRSTNGLPTRPSSPVWAPSARMVTRRIGGSLARRTMTRPAYSRAIGPMSTNARPPRTPSSAVPAG